MSIIPFPAPLAPYATKAVETRGRLYEEPESATRTPFQRDRDRVIHAIAFRRLKHKTQVFVYHQGDHYRTRLTHSLEVAQISRTMARVLALDEDLAECLALAHDIGHPPFGHTGEDVLQECMANYQGFDHNAHTLRLLTRLERRHAAFHGLNLSWETLDGVVKHNGPLTGPLAFKMATMAGKTLSPLPEAIADYNQRHDLDLARFSSLEAQIAALADDIAYNNHDVDDGLRAGLFSLEEALNVPLVGAVISATRARFAAAPDDLLIAEAVSAMIGEMVADVLAETKRRLAALDPHSAEDIRAADRPMVAFSEGMQGQVSELRAFLFENMYRHEKVNQERRFAKKVVRELFEAYVADSSLLPQDWKAHYPADDQPSPQRMVCDYIAGMTDRFAYREHQRLFGPNKAG